MSRKEKELVYVLTSVANRLSVIKLEQEHDRFIIFYLIFSLLSGAIGAVLLLFGLRKTVLFDFYTGKDYVAIAFGCLFCLPCVLWMIHILFPFKSERSLRLKLKHERKERKRPTLFNEMVEKAKKSAEPPPRKIRVIVIFRKKEYPIIGSTMRDFVEALEHQTGLPIERQVIRYQGEDLEIHLDKKLDEFYGMDNDSRLYVYNQGGYFTQDSQIKKEYEILTLKLNAEINAAQANQNPNSNTLPMLKSNEKDKRPRSSMREERQQSSIMDWMETSNNSGHSRSNSISKNRVSWAV
jgi:hypothetical protein